MDKIDSRVIHDCKFSIFIKGQSRGRIMASYSLICRFCKYDDSMLKVLMKIVKVFEGYRVSK